MKSKLNHPAFVELDADQHAPPDKCGSCNQFKRRNGYDTFGICHLELPPFVLKFIPFPETWEVDPRTVRDTDTCSFYEAAQSEGKFVEFRQPRSWRAGN